MFYKEMAVDRKWNSRVNVQSDASVQENRSSDLLSEQTDKAVVTGYFRS